MADGTNVENEPGQGPAAVRRLKREQRFVEPDPVVLVASPEEVSSISGAFHHGRPVFLEEMRPVGLVIAGSVAVSRLGTRGGSYADLEYGLAIAAGVVSPDTPVVTTVHQIQVLDEDLP